MAGELFYLEFDGYWREEDIEDIPSKSGIYCVYGCMYGEGNKLTIGKLIYIGESGNVSDRVNNHKKRKVWKGYLNKRQKLCFSYAYFYSSHRERVEAALINRHKPPANIDFVINFPFDKTKINISGKKRFLETSFTVNRMEK